MRTQQPTTLLAGRYALEEQLGRSNTGMVWKASDTVLRRAVTVKLVHPELADDPSFSTTLERETRRLASLSAPGLAALLDSGRKDGVIFLVREHIEGVGARSLLDRGPLPVHEAVRIAMGVAEALVPAHDADVLHLSLDLDDVLVTPGGEVRVTDVGVGAAVCSSLDPSDVARVLGAGIAPEQRTGAPVGPSTDVFRVGALLFELLTGEAPGDRSSAHALRDEMPGELDRVVTRALAPHPAERFDDLRALAEGLRPFARGALDDASRREPWLRTWLAVPLAIACGAALVIALGLGLGRLEVGGPLGIRPAEEEPSSPQPPATRTVQPVAVSTLDPFGDGVENDGGAHLAADGDIATAWRSENYFDGRLNKPGVGLVLDLGESHQVVGIRLSTPDPGFTFQVAVSDDLGSLQGDIGVPITADADTRAAAFGSGRYVLVWITSVVPTADGNRAVVAEGQVVTSDA